MADSSKPTPMEEEVQLTKTENGAACFSSAGDKCVDLFFKTVRGIDEAALTALLDAAWAEDQLTCLKIIAICRDCRGGKGERRIATQSWKWLATKNAETALKNLKHVPFFGCWKDLLELVEVPQLHDAILQLFAQQLRDDLAALQEKGDVSLCAKWAPSEGHSHDKKNKVAHELAKLLCKDDHYALVAYRKQYLAPLRKHLQVTERWMCARQWDNIPYSRVASRCMNLNKKVFQKHDDDRFKQFLLDVASGKKTITGKQLYPHELTKQYQRSSTVDPVIELQWNEIIKSVTEKGTLGSCLVLSDVSGSMSGTPMEISIALGVLISQVTSDPFKNLVLTFESTPRFCDIGSGTLASRVQALARAPWGGSTNLALAFDCILQKAKQHRLSAEDMPKKLVIISDMQFDAADSSYKTTHRSIQDKYAAAGYTMPMIVYWNVRANTVGFPACADMPNVALVSGYSPSLLKLFMESDELSEDQLPQPPTPLELLQKALADERYNRLEI